MKFLSRLAFVTWLLFFSFLKTKCINAQSLPDGWWLQGSPEKVLAKAQAINQGLAFYYAKKIGSPFSQTTNPFGKTNDNARVEFFQRKSANGSVETKRFTLDGNFQETDYKLKDGHYVFLLGQMIKTEFVYEDAEEISNAAKFDHPYDFKILKSEMVGTNDCIVIARCMTPEFLNAMK